MAPKRRRNPSISLGDSRSSGSITDHVPLCHSARFKFFSGPFFSLPSDSSAKINESTSSYSSVTEDNTGLLDAYKKDVYSSSTSSDTDLSLPDFVQNNSEMHLSKLQDHVPLHNSARFRFFSAPFFSLPSDSSAKINESTSSYSSVTEDNTGLLDAYKKDVYSSNTSSDTDLLLPDFVQNNSEMHLSKLQGSTVDTEHPSTSYHQALSSEFTLEVRPIMVNGLDGVQTALIESGVPVRPELRQQLEEVVWVDNRVDAGEGSSNQMAPEFDAEQYIQAAEMLSDNDK